MAVLTHGPLATYPGQSAKPFTGIIVFNLCKQLIS